MDLCQVDFYLLARPELDARHMACRLALMSWERGHHTIVVTDSDSSAAQIDALMWESPAGRFLPHETDNESASGTAPVVVTQMSLLPKARLKENNVVINLCTQAIPEPGKFNRLLEIVPHQTDARQASREKFKYYRGLGISPGTHEINK